MTIQDKIVHYMKVKGSLTITLFLLLLAVILIMGGGAYLWQQGKTTSLTTGAPTPTPSSTIWSIYSLSSAYIYGPQLNKVKVFLYAPNQQQSRVEETDIFCGAPVVGANRFEGDYELILDPSTATSDNPGQIADFNWKSSRLNLSPLVFTFVEGTDWDGALLVEKLDPDGYKNFIIVYQYGSCSFKNLSIYGYDFGQGELFQYRFASNGQISDSITVALIDGLSIPEQGGIITKEYNQFTGQYDHIEWELDPQDGLFHAIQSWETTD